MCKTANAGTYSVVVNNSYGSATSANAILTVGGCGCSPQPGGLVSWWPGEWNLSDVMNNNSATQGGPYAGGEVGQGFNVTGSSSYVMVPASGSLNVGAGNGFTIEGWEKVVDSSTSGHPLFEWATPSNYGVHLWVNYAYLGCLFVNVFDTTGNSHYYWSIRRHTQRVSARGTDLRQNQRLRRGLPQRSLG
jgi:hypothetical protein